MKKLIFCSMFVILYLIVFSNRGYAAWGNQTVDTAYSAGQDSSLALDSDGHPHISYYDSTNDDLKYAEWTGSSWLISTVDSPGDVGEYTSLVLDNAGNPRISYRDYTNKDLKYAEWTGSSWLISTADSLGDVGEYTSLALDSDGHPHISYYDSTNDDLKYAEWNGSSWVVSTVDPSYKVGQYTSLALDSAGNPHISYYDDWYDDLKYAEWTGIKWSTNTVDSSGYVGQYTSLALDNAGHPHISYYDYANYDLKYAEWTGIKWSTTTVDSTGDVGQYTSLALDSAGHPHISYYNSTNDYLKYAEWTGNSWLVGTVIYCSYVGQYTSLALDSADVPHISYYNYVNNGLNYVKKTSRPELAWAGEPNYVSDGLDPEIGGASTVFTFKVKYLDLDGEAPASGYPRVVIEDGSYPDPDKTLTLQYVSGDYLTGAIYSSTTTLPFSYSSTKYNYRFEAYDVWYASATNFISGSGPKLPNISGYVKNSDGSPISGVLVTLMGSLSATTTTDLSGYYQFDPPLGGNYTVIPSSGNYVFSPANMTYTNLSSVMKDRNFSRIAGNPKLSWTGEPNYTADGLDPESGDSSTVFNFKVKYADTESDPPKAGFPRVVIKAGSSIIYKTLVLNYESGDYAAGAIYSTSTTLSFSFSEEFQYYYEASDIWEAKADNVYGQGPGKISISGYIENPGGSGMSGVLVTLSGLTVSTATTNSSGYYIFKPVISGNYLVTPSTGNCKFSPPNRSYQNLSAAQVNQDFNRIGNNPVLSWTGEPNYESDGLHPNTGNNSTFLTYKVKYADPEGDPPDYSYPKVVIKDGPNSYDTYETLTMAYVSGDYKTGAIYSVTTTLPFYYSDVYSYRFEAYDVWDDSATNFISKDGPFPKIYISGSIRYPSGSGMSGILVTLSGSTTSTTTTNSSGYYSFEPEIGGAYMVTPSSGNCRFNPPSRSYKDLSLTQSNQDFSRIVGNPVLSWTGEANYESDGLHPQIGNNSTVFTYKVKYADPEGDPPDYSYPKVVIKDGPNSYDTYETLTMAYVSGDYKTGAIYSVTTTLPFYYSDVYSYRFEAYDVWDDSATNFISKEGPFSKIYIKGYVKNPANVGIIGLEVRISGDQSASVYTGSDGSYSFNNLTADKTYTITPVAPYFNPPSRFYKKISEGYDDQDFVRAQSGPTLSWVGGNNYENDGVNSEKGYESTIFIFRVKYSDAENDPPFLDYPEIHLLKNGLEISGSPFLMSEENTGDKKYDDGKLYTFSRQLNKGFAYSYFMGASDIWGASASGEPCEPKAGLEVSALQLPPTGEVKIVGGAATRGTINPNKGDKAEIYFNSSQTGDFTCKIFSVDGELIFESTESNVNNGAFEWSPNNIASGIYIVSVKGPGVNFRGKLAILR